MKHASEHSLPLRAAQAGRPGVSGRHALRLAVAGALLAAGAPRFAFSGRRRGGGGLPAGPTPPGGRWAGRGAVRRL